MKTSILGAGAWGTAIAMLCAKNPENQVTLWGRDAKLLESLSATRQHPAFKIAHLLPENITYEADLDATIQGAEILFCVIPTQNMREFLTNAPKISPNAIMVNCAKGLEQEKLQLPHTIIKEFHNGPCLTLSGPNFAVEIVQGLPAASVIAGSENENESIRRAVTVLKSNQFRPYYHFDQIGLEAASVIKNIIAIATGIAMGMNLGENARAALITRGLNEMILFSENLGGMPSTIYGLGGIGDLLLTCSSLKSRNASFGFELAQGNVDLDGLDNMGDKTIEGVFSAKAVKNLFPDLDLPIIDTVYQAIYHKKPIPDLLMNLFNRSIKLEN